MKFTSALSFLLVGTAAAFAPAPVSQRSSSVRLVIYIYCMLNYVDSCAKRCIIYKMKVIRTMCLLALSGTMQTRMK